MQAFDKTFLHDFPDRAIRKLLDHPQNLQELVEAVAPDLAPHFDFGHVEKVRRDFLLEDWRGRESDVLVRVPYRSPDGDQWVLVVVLVEHQSRPDPRMPLRILLYALLYWESEWKAWEDGHPPGESLRLSPVLPIVFHTGQQRWTTHRELADLIAGPDEMRVLAPQWPVLFWDLADRSPQELLDEAGGWLRALAVVRAEEEETETFLQVFEEVLRRLEAIGAEDRIRWHDLMWFVLSWAFRRRPAEEKDLLEKSAKKSQKNPRRRKQVQEMSQTVKQSWGDVLLEQGKAEGRADAALEIRREDLRLLLEHRFGKVPDEVLQRIEATTDPARLQACFRQAFDVSTPEELEL